MSYFNFLAKSLNDHIFTDPAYTPPATLYIGLSSTTPNEDETGITEPPTGGYARIATVAADWGPSTDADPSVKTTTVAKVFAVATGDWSGGANMTHFLLFDAISAGQALAFEAVTTAKPVFNGDTARFEIGDITFTLD